MTIYICRERTSDNKAAMVLRTGANNDFKLSETIICRFVFKQKKWLSISKQQERRFNKVYSEALELEYENYVVYICRNYEYQIITSTEALRIIEKYRAYL
jgi:hypothetical protein